MKTYKGIYEGKGTKRNIAVTVIEDEPDEEEEIEKPLSPCLNIVNHSPTGFNWGYHGSGPAQLALAILVDYLGDKDKAYNLHQEFKQLVIANLKSAESWELTSRDIERALVKIYRKRFSET